MPKYTGLCNSASGFLCFFLITLPPKQYTITKIEKNRQTLYTKSGSSTLKSMQVASNTEGKSSCDGDGVASVCKQETKQPIQSCV